LRDDPNVLRAKLPTTSLCRPRQSEIPSNIKSALATGVILTPRALLRVAQPADVILEINRAVEAVASFNSSEKRKKR
jgi:hypothetical protein